MCRLRDELAWDQAHYAAAVQAIQEAPAMFLWASVVRVGRLWQLVPHAESAERESPSMRRLRYLVGVWYGGVFGLAAVGMWRRRKDLAQSPWIWCLILAACFTALHAVYWTNMRMRAPLMPAVALVAAAGWGKSGKPKAESGENGARNQPEGGGA